MIHAEKHCWKLNNDDILFSPQVLEYGYLWNFWKQILKIKRSNRRSPKYIIKEAKVLGIRLFNALSINQIETATDTAKVQYHQAKTSHRCFYNSFLQDHQSTHLKQAESRRKLRNRFRKMNSIFGKKRLATIAEVQIIRNRSSVVISSREELETAIMNNNSKRFTLAHESPLMQHEYQEQFGAFGNTAFCLDLLQGTAELSHLPPEIRSMLQLFSLTPSLSTPYYINFQRWKDHWKRSKEKTSSSISGRHFRHMKVSSKEEDILFLHLAPYT